MANMVMNDLEKDLHRMRAGGYTQYAPGPEAYRSGSSQGYYQQNTGPHFAQQNTFSQPQPVYEQSAAVTYNDVVNKSGLMFGGLFLAAVLSWGMAAARPELAGSLTIVGLLGGLVFAMIGIFKSTVSPTVFMAYAILEGVGLGALSFTMEFVYPGIVSQALVGTLAVFSVTLLLFRSGYVRNSPGLMKFALISLVSILVYSLANMVLSMMGVLNTPFGLDSLQVFGIPLGVLVSLFAIFVGAVCLVIDFDVAQKAVQMGAPKQIAWKCAFGLVIDTVYIYVYILRLLAIFRQE